MKVLSLYFVIAVATLSVTSFRYRAESLQLNNLRCEMLVDPRGIDAKAPRLSWEIVSNERGVEQKAYQVLVASSLEKLDAGQGDKWNSGKIDSDKSIHVNYRGSPLETGKECFWKVKVWSNKGESGWSKPAYWSVGLLTKADWKAKWIGLDRAFPWDSVTKMARLSARYFRTDFDTPKKLKRATLYISGLGLYELYLNGQKIGDQVLAPSPTDYSKSVMYNSFDVTDKLKQGKNAVAAVLGNGRFFTMRQKYKPQKWHNFGYPKMLLQLEIEFTDGTKKTVISDDKWKVTSDGPIRTNNEYDGEEYDATKEMPGWNSPSFNDAKWFRAELVKDPGGVIKAQMNHNMKVMETIKPVSVKELTGGKHIIDMGQNMAGWIKMNLKGRRGDQVVLRYAESLQPGGELYTANLRDAMVTDKYTLKGGADETWSPTFVFHGFRYVEVTNYPGKPTIDDFRGEVVYDNIETIGQFETSNKTINQVYKNAYWGIRSNYKGMPIDCPQRNERQPWLGDRTTGAYGESFIFENSTLYSKWLEDIEESQTTEGSIPDVAPNFWYYYKDDVTWPATYLTIADMLYNQYGDKQPIAKHYASMKKWMEYMKKKYMVNYIFSKDSYGDWCVPPESPSLIHSKDSSRITDPKLLATATYYHMLQLMQKFAGLAGKASEAVEYAGLALKIREAFNEKFYDKQKKQYSNNTVTANILPLAFDMVPAHANEEVFKNIVNKTMNENNGHISTGVIGTQWLMRWLTLYGRPDIAYRLASIRDYPSWGYMAENGATTIWELWNGNTANPQMNSQNHVMLLGDLVVWFYENLAGIKSLPGHPAFKVIEMKPSIVDGLDHVKASYHSMHGLIKSEWRKNGKEFTWNITVPANTKAIVYIPGGSAGNVTEAGKNVSSSNGIKVTGMDGDKVVLEIGSGDYSFASSW